VTESPSTVPVTAADLRVGDVIKSPDGHYYAVDTLPEPSGYREDYAEPGIWFWATETNESKTKVADKTQHIHSPEVVLTVLTPRPEG
jgi:hypothetical protein